jgi:hypothetical protein
VLFFSTFAAFGLEQLPASAPLPHVVAYRGFQIDASLIAGRADATSILASAKQQVDIVLSVNLKSDVVEFFRNYRVNLVPDLAAHGRYSTNGIELSASATPSSMPVLLHEYLHASHEKKLPGGRANLEILSYYRRAKEIAAYPPAAYTLRNPSEFFAK